MTMLARPAKVCWTELEMNATDIFQEVILGFYHIFIQSLPSASSFLGTFE
jgi:hypothetical protein